MPLKKCTPAAQYENYLITGGPRPRGVNTRPALQSLVMKHFGKHIKEIHVAEEDGEQEEHFHIAVILDAKLKWKSLFNEIIQLITSWKKTQSTGSQQPNCSFHYAPAKKATTILEEYLKIPKKDKEVDANIVSSTKPIDRLRQGITGANPADSNLLCLIRDTKGSNKPVFHKFNCTCTLCV